MFRPAFVDGRRGFTAPDKSGRVVFYAPVLPRDEGRLRAGVKALSPASRYLRFVSPGDQLTEEQVRRFTHPDQVDHIAFGALDTSKPDLPGLGLGRMVRLASDPATAEMAIAVVDAAQNLGIGTVLLATLCAATRRAGIAELLAWVLPENRLVLDWFARLGARVEAGGPAAGTEEVRLPVPQPPPIPDGPAPRERFRAMINQIERVLPEG